MKKTIFLLLLLNISMLAKTHRLSPIPLPSIFIQNLSPFDCKEKCLMDFINKKFIFSLLSFTSPKLKSDMELLSVDYAKLKDSYSQEVQVSKPAQSSKIKIALLLPYKTIGKYASSTTNATLAYLMLKNYPFDVKTYKINSESEEEISQAIEQIQRDGYEYIIAPLTKKGESSLSNISIKANLYIPTINKNDASRSAKNIYYGGIDYKAQSKKLLEFAKNKLYIFSDNSNVAQQLSLFQESEFKNSNPASPSKIYTLPEKITNLDSMLKNNSRVDGASIFINTPIVKSAMVLSQLTLFDIDADNILSIQTNYTPLLFSMTQFNDRKNIIIANSIINTNDNLSEINSLLDNDISYDWINYTTTVGVDYFAYLMYGQTRDFDIDVVDNAMAYPIELITSSTNKFIPYNAKP